MDGESRGARPAGPVTAAPAVRAPRAGRGRVADLLRDESRMTAAGVASVAEPATLDELRQVMRWHADRRAPRHRQRRAHRRDRGRGARGLDAPRVGGPPARHRRPRPPGEPPMRAGARRHDAARTARRARHPRAWLSRCRSTRPRAGASVGGMVATNAAGSRAFRFGATRDWVVGLTVELASGRTLELRRGRDRAEGDAVTLVDGDERAHGASASHPEAADQELDRLRLHPRRRRAGSVRRQRGHARASSARSRCG